MKQVDHLALVLNYENLLSLLIKQARGSCFVLISTTKLCWHGTENTMAHTNVRVLTAALLFTYLPFMPVKIKEVAVTSEK